MKEIIIASLNMNGETWNLNNKIPRLPKSMLDVDLIKEKMTERTRHGIEIILKKQLYDIIAIQELVCFSEYHNVIKTCIENNEYRLIEPSISCSTHFTVGYIIKKQLIKQIISSSEEICETNRFFTLKIKNEHMVINLINVHLKESVNLPCYDYEKLKNLDINDQNQYILIGDFNSFSKQQISTETNSNNDLIKNIISTKFKECGKDKDYTFVSNNIKKKLDHIFISNGINENEKEYLTINNDVNFCINDKEGFTDHSMLIARLV